MNVFFKILFATIFFFATTLSGQVRSEKTIVTGAERLDYYLPLLQGQRVALCANQTARVGTRHLLDTLLLRKINVVKIFSPEHGFRGKTEAGAHVNSGIDKETGIPVVSLYGSNKKPTAGQLQNIDIIFFDIQDVGCRFYTYISTLHHVMEAAAEQGIRVIVADRPNPNGFYVDGPVLIPSCRSFVGMHPVPIVHGMTIGEYARMINGEKWLSNGKTCNLQIVEMENYTHSTRYTLPVAPSPNLNTAEAILLYPSLCLFEGTDISIGRGTPLPFQRYGHPLFEEGDDIFTPVATPGVAEHPPHEGKRCQGYNLTRTAQQCLSLKNDTAQACNSINLKYLIHAYQQFPDKTRFFSRPDMFDKLAGTPALRQQITQNYTENDIRASWKEGILKFKKIRAKYLLYPDF
ncbi:MAG: DUF1343 domain-containing protein [Bacteroidales bacterium]|jgi:uncharacterized protein YbbC (DUF1343 family)|nr:DUF1343 domain-containing protein [Bacteroidales bacterium]